MSLFSPLWLLFLRRRFANDGRQKHYKLFQMAFYRLCLNIMVCLEHYVSPAHIKVERQTIKDNSHQQSLNNHTKCTWIGDVERKTKSHSSLMMTVAKSKSELFLCSEVYVLGFRHFCMAEKLTRLCGKKSVSHCFLVFVNIYLTVTGHSKQITHSLVKQVYLWAKICRIDHYAVVQLINGCHVQRSNHCHSALDN